MWNKSRKAVRHIYKREDGNAMIEIAVVLPILVVLFVGAAEIGRMFYSYTTLAKATKVGARYLSTSALAVSNVTDQNTVTAQVKNLVVCGYIDCTNQPKILPGLDVANVDVTLPVIGASPAFCRVQITGYTFRAGAFNLAARIGVANATIYNATSLTPGITMRYMKQ
jgi:hypothetical protein